MQHKVEGMRVLSDEEDEDFRQRVREELGFHHEPSEGWEPLDMADSFVVGYTEGDYEEKFENEAEIVEARSQDYRENLQKTLGLIGERENSVYILAFEKGQYTPQAQQKLEKEMNGNVAEGSPEEIEEIIDELIVVYILSDNLDWAILLDHDGNIHFSGEIKDEASEEFKGEPDERN